MSASHYGLALSAANLPINSIYCPLISTGAVISTANVLPGNTASVVLTAAQIVNGIIIMTGTTASTTVTPPSPATVVAYLLGQGIKVSTSSPFEGFGFTIVNQNTQSVSLASETNTTQVLGSATIATVTSKSYKYVLTSATTASIYG